MTLIANVSAHGFVVAGVLGLELTWRLWRAGGLSRLSGIAATLLAGGLGLFALWSAWQPADNGFLQPETRPPLLPLTVYYLRNAFIDRISVWSSAPPSPVDTVLSAVLSVLVLLPSFKLMMVGLNRAMALGVCGMLIRLSAFVQSNQWHAGLLFLSWLFLLWVEWGNLLSAAIRRQVILAIAAVCVMQGVHTLRTGLWDMAHAYPPGRQVANALIAYRNMHPHALIFAHNFRAFEVQPWLSANPFPNYHEGAPRPSYIVWARQESWPVATDPILAAIARRRARPCGFGQQSQGQAVRT